MPSADNLARLWEEHTNHEFVTHDTESTLATMVDDAYVNHIPVMTGGFGKAALRDFYSRHFIPSMPPDTTLTPVSRTVDENELVDEMIFPSPTPKRCPGRCPASRLPIATLKCR
jgi:carboxymethylenebutenolidase